MARAVDPTVRRSTDGSTNAAQEHCTNPISSQLMIVTAMGRVVRASGAWWWHTITPPCGSLMAPQLPSADGAVLPGDRIFLQRVHSRKDRHMGLQSN